ncbi:MAG: GGDEF domain-containing protein [Leptospiraceae bacterium]|nr:GGDEF domain-containing protein [Leptospiraceae bacterium]
MIHTADALVKWNHEVRQKLTISAYITAALGLATYIPGTILSAYFLDHELNAIHALIRCSVLVPIGLAALLTYAQKMNPMVLAYVTWLSLFGSAAYASAALIADPARFNPAVLANVPIIITPALLLFWQCRHTLANLLLGSAMNVSCAFWFHPHDFRGYTLYWLMMLPLALGAMIFSWFRLYNFKKLFFINVQLEQTRDELQESREQLENRNREMEEILKKDALTGLFNRRYFFQKANIEIKRALQFSHPVSILILDLDHFKSINDRFGHHVGDQVLRLFAAHMQAHLSAFEYCCRIGGEEFVLILPELNLTEAAARAESIRQMVAGIQVTVSEGVEPLHLTTSIGAAELQAADESLETLLQRADKNLYQAKADGRNLVVA